MKFGNKILAKSVPEWKLNNIDYEKLKKAIKRATTESGDGSDGENLERCTQLFREQFNHVNVFTSLKVKEITSRLVAIETSIINYKKRFPQSEGSDARNRKLQARQLKMVASHLDNCSSELQRLSRFLILQKIALGKLFKKFVKHYPVGTEEAEAYIQRVRGLPELTGGYDGISFTSVDLDPYLLEISLIVNILHNFQSKLAGDGSYSDEEIVSPRNKKIDSSLAFDRVVLATPSLQKFLVCKENIEEFKFMILNHGFHMLDDEIISTSKGIRDTTDTIPSVDAKSIKSVRSFVALQQAIGGQQAHHPVDATTPTSQGQDGLAKNQPSASSLHRSQPQLSLSILDNKANPAFLEDNSVNQHPNLVMVSDDDDSHCILMCHVGGLRDHLETTEIGFSNLKKMMSGIEVDEDHEKTENSAVAKLALEWVQSRHLRPVGPRIDFKRTRFICNEGGSTYLISLDEDVTMGSGDAVPHAFVQLTKLQNSSAPDNKDKKAKEICDALIENKTQSYPLSSHITLWRVCFKLYRSHNLQADLFKFLLKDEYDIEDDSLNSEEFFLLGRDSTLQMCSDKFISGLESEGNNRRQSTIQVKHKEPPAVEKPRVRYWNEFDDDPEFFNDNGFYIEDNNGSQSGDERGLNSDSGFILFNKDFIASSYCFCQKLRGWLGWQDMRATLAAEGRGSRYGSIGGSMSSASTNSFDDVQAYLAGEDDENDSVYEYKHDQVITFMYLSSLFTGCVTAGISLGIVLALFHREGTEADLEVADFLIAMIATSLIISLTLICISLLLLFSRFKLAPAWHYITCFILFLVVIFTVCYGFTEIFF